MHDAIHPGAGHLSGSSLCGLEVKYIAEAVNETIRAMWWSPISSETLRFQLRDAIAHVLAVSAADRGSGGAREQACRRLARETRVRDPQHAARVRSAGLLPSLEVSVTVHPSLSMVGLMHEATHAYLCSLCNSAHDDPIPRQNNEIATFAIAKFQTGTSHKHKLPFCLAHVL